jgi:aspartyl-tRNA(Asn)/glutamyl-tRNA(Gln) amidotransferase subunit C
VTKLSRILEFVDQLRQADTAGVEPMAHPLAMAQRLRPDEVTETDQRDRVQRNAPFAEHGLYLVPRVIE